MYIFVVLLFIDKVFLKDAVVGCGAYKLTIMYAYTLYGSFKTYFAVSLTDDLLMEHAFDAFTCDIKP